YPDLDASPTKAFVVLNHEQYPAEFQYAVGLRPEIELYDVRSDPDCLNNLAGSPEVAEIQKGLHERLINEMTSTGDPRVSNDIIFERSPYSDPVKKRKPPR
ncbi:MAG: sulfatase, partial [Planctomycetota bacterium]